MKKADRTASEGFSTYSMAAGNMFIKTDGITAYKAVIVRCGGAEQRNFYTLRKRILIFRRETLSALYMQS